MSLARTRLGKILLEVLQENLVESVKLWPAKTGFLGNFW